jgi:predicted PurR-regulated permease PerM
MSDRPLTDPPQEPTPPTDPPAEEAIEVTGEDWRGLFHLYCFLDLSLSDRKLERREVVWIKRYLTNHGMRHLHPHMYALIGQGGCDQRVLGQLVERAARKLNMGEKRRFIYNLAQLVQSKGSIGQAEYENILNLSEKIGVPDTEADAIINSVYNVNDTFMTIVGMLAIGAILYFTQVVIVPLVIAIFITMIILKVEGAIASALHLRRFRWLNKLAAMVLVLGFFFGLAMAASVSGRDIANRFPYYEDRISHALQSSETAQAALEWFQESGVVDQLKQVPVGSMVSSFLGSLFKLLGNFLLIVIFTGFLVFSSSSFTGILQEMNEKISAYISVKTLISLLTGALVYALCRIFGIDFALFWAILGFLLNYIPSVGSIAASIPPILLSMVQLESWALVGLFALIMTVTQIFLGQVLEPKLMGTRLALKPVAILLGLIFWGFLWGIPGMFLATPLMALLRILSSYFNFSRGFERLLAADKR